MATTALGRLLQGRPLLKSIEADFERCTWTFRVPGDFSFEPGQFLVVPATDARQAMAQDEAGVFLPATQGCAKEVTFFHGNGYRSINVLAEDGSFEVRVQTTILPDPDDRHWIPGRWYGHEARRDALGRKWDRILGSLVVNDFGDLVPMGEGA